MKIGYTKEGMQSRNILGVGGSIHDFSSCLLQDGVMKYCIEDERIVRKKHAFYPGVAYELARKNAAHTCMELAGFTYDDIELAVGNDILSHFYYHKLQGKVKNFVLINHHLAHACSAFFPSDFSEAAILTIDGGGNYTENEEQDDRKFIEVCSFGYGTGNKVIVSQVQNGERSNAEQFDNKIDPVLDSIGGFYGAITYASGFTFHEEGKTMGLSSYGDSSMLKEIRSYTSLKEKGAFGFSLEGMRMLYELREQWEKETDKERQFEIRANIAYAGQKIAEDAIIHAASYLKEETKADNICIAGGVALNSVANYKLYKTGLFKNYFIQPAAGDNGTSIGAAYYGWHMVMNQPRQV